MDASQRDSDAPAGEAASRRRRRRWILPSVLAPLVALTLLVIAWAVDTSSGQVARNVQLARADVGGLTADELTGRLAQVAADFAATPVKLSVGRDTYSTTAGAIGIMVDQDRSATSALHARSGGFLLARPVAWVASFFSTHQAPLALQVNAAQVAREVVRIEGEHRRPPTEPVVKVVGGALSVVPGVDGVGIDLADVVRRLPAVAAAAVDDGTGVITLDLDAAPIPPLGSLDEARAIAAEAEALVAKPLTVHTSSGDRTITSALLRSWVRLTSRLDGTVAMALDEPSVEAGLRHLFADVDGHPLDASFTLVDGRVVIRPDKPGRVCCGTGVAPLVQAALSTTPRVVDLALTEGRAAFTSADAKAYGIARPVGGNNAWRDGAPTTAGAGFTTFHDPTGARITNIHRIADLVRGAVIPPGGRFSINDYVGERTIAKGFVLAGAIRDGEHVEEVGGGVSQFATTTFNAAYFAGLKINSYQAHSEYFSRYPRGREATMGYPAPDLVFTNDTPYGIMIWTSYTSSSLTVTLYSTPYGSAAQTGITESASGSCTVVTTTRTITYPGGKTATDHFRASYRPAGVLTC